MIAPQPVDQFDLIKYITFAQYSYTNVWKRAKSKNEYFPYDTILNSFRFFHFAMDTWSVNEEVEIEFVQIVVLGHSYLNVVQTGL